MKIVKEPNHIAQEYVRQNKAVLIDVREKVEFNESALAGAINLPMSSFALSDYEQFKDKKIYLICHSGNRSKRVAKILEREGEIEATLVEHQMEHFIKTKDLPPLQGWTIDRQFRMTLGILLVVFLLGFNFISPYFLVIPIILATGLVITSLINRCYMRMGIAALPWNKNKN